jgi:hypothetical protein
MGTHPSGPATLASQPEQTLKEWIQANPAALGDRVLKRFGVDLPYLFKVRHVQQCAAAATAVWFVGKVAHKYACRSGTSTTGPFGCEGRCSLLVC